MRLPQPMLARSGALPSGDYAFELKWDGFRAIVGCDGDFRVRSRRGWDMTTLFLLLPLVVGSVTIGTGSAARPFPSP